MFFWARFFSVIACVVFGFWVTFWFPQDVFISWNGYEVYTKTPLLWAIFMLILVLWRILRGGWRWAVSLPSRCSLWLGRRQHHTKQQLIFDILLALEAEDLKETEKLLQKSDKYFQNEPFIFYLKRQWAHLSGNQVQEREALDGLSAFPGGAFFYKKQEIEKAMTRQDHPEAILLLEGLLHQKKGAPWVIKNLLPLYLEHEKFSQAEALLNQMTLPSFSEEAVKKERAHLLYAQALATQNDPLQQESLLRKAYFLDARFLEAAVQLARLLGQQKKEKKAQAILEATWRHTPHPDIALVYQELFAGAIPIDRFTRLQHLAETNPNHPLSHWMLGQAALEAQLWVPARDHLMHLVVKKPSLAYPLLAQLEQRQHNDWKAACQWLEKEALLKESALIVKYGHPPNPLPIGIGA